MSSDNTDNRDAFRAELDRVLESEAIRHSAGLRRLLAYLGEKTLDEDTDELKEYSIGIDVFHKSEDYDPQHDPSVRVLASKLRHKLDEYYFKEGADDPVRIEIPKGHYRVKFVQRDTPGPAGATTPASEIRKWRTAAITFAALTILLALWITARQRGVPAGDPVSSGGQLWTPDLELIWQPYLESERPIIVSLGTPLFTKFSEGFFREPQINDWTDASESGKLKSIQEQLGSSYAVPWYGYTGVGEATGAFLLARLFGEREKKLDLKRSSVLSWDDIKSHNLIFLGSSRFNPQLRDIPVDQAFVIRGGSVYNLDPRPGERAEYTHKWGVSKDILLEDYALVSRFPGLHGRGDIMVLGSRDTHGTWAAVEYVTQRAYAEELVARLKLPSGDLPTAYQVLIRAQFRDNVPTEISYVTHRVLKQHPS